MRAAQASRPARSLLVGEGGAQLFVAPRSARIDGAGRARSAPGARADQPRAATDVSRRRSDRRARRRDRSEPRPACVPRETFSAPLSDARSTIGMLQLVNRTDEGATEDWVLRMVSLLAGQVTRGIVVRREREAAERAERLALLGHSVGAILHDMRTPMTAVGGYAELMAAEDDAALRARLRRPHRPRARAHGDDDARGARVRARQARDPGAEGLHGSLRRRRCARCSCPRPTRYGVQLVIDAALRRHRALRREQDQARDLQPRAQRVSGDGHGRHVHLDRQARAGELDLRVHGHRPRHSQRDGRQVVRVVREPRQEPTAPGSAWRWRRRSSTRTAARSSARSTPGQGATFRIQLPC